MDSDEETPLFFEFEIDEEGFTLCTNMTDEQVVEMLVEQFHTAQHAGDGSLSDDLVRAIGECRTYNRMGALDHEMILDIAHDHEVDPREVYRGLEWEWPSDDPH